MLLMLQVPVRCSSKINAKVTHSLHWKDITSRKLDVREGEMRSAGGMNPKTFGLGRIKLETV